MDELTLAPVPEGKRCGRCKEFKPRQAFGFAIARPSKLRSYCRTCEQLIKRLVRYGLTPEQFDTLLAKQGGGCAICGVKNPPGYGWDIDHDHVTGATRGLLCHRCNVRLGPLEIEGWTEKAMAYLQRHSTR